MGSGVIVWFLANDRVAARRPQRLIPRTLIKKTAESAEDAEDCLPANVVFALFKSSDAYLRMNKEHWPHKFVTNYAHNR